ncbi:MAG: OsmC family protein [Bacteroidales bacterium]|nr:OsmC family protein [Bacteroidales bacterium]
MKIYFEDKLKVFADFEGYTIKTDQPVKSGGDGDYPAPFSLFLASLGTCAGIYVKGFCDSRKIPVENISLSQRSIYDPVKKIIGRIEITIHIPVDFPEKYEAALIHSAALCAVKRHLRDDIEVKVKTERAVS